MPSDEQRFVVGLVRGLHGLQGAVRVEPLSDDPARFEPGSTVYPEGTSRRLTIEWAQEDAPGLLVRFHEIRTREAADRLRDVYLEVERPAGEPEPGAYWWHEIVSQPVVTATGEELGTVADVFRAGGGEVYVVRGGPRGELLIPAVEVVFREFAPREGRIVVDAGALGLEPLRPRRPRGRRSSKRPETDAAPESANERNAPTEAAGEPNAPTDGLTDEERAVSERAAEAADPGDA